MYEPRKLITASDAIAVGVSHTYSLGNDEKDCWPYLLDRSGIAG